MVITNYILYILIYLFWHKCIFFQLYKYQEFTLILNEQIVRDLLSKLLYLLSMKGPENSTDTQLFGRCVNSLIMNVLERSAHTPVTW